MRIDPLAYLGEELRVLQQQNLYRTLRVLEVIEHGIRLLPDELDSPHVAEPCFVPAEDLPLSGEQFLDPLGRHGVDDRFEPLVEPPDGGPPVWDRRMDQCGS